MCRSRSTTSSGEKLDGSGCPLGLRGDELSLPARLLVVADIFEALTADRPYRDALTTEVALALMRPDRGIKLCAVAFDALVASTGAERAQLLAA